jgi:PAS domain S-box-containing protein
MYKRRSDTTPVPPRNSALTHNLCILPANSRYSLCATVHRRCEQNCAQIAHGVISLRIELTDQLSLNSTDLQIESSEAPASELQRDVIQGLLQQVIEFTPSGVALTAMDGRIVLVNAELERMFGYSRASLLDSLIERLLPKQFRTQHAKSRDGTSNDLRLRTAEASRELIGLHANGTEFPIEIGINMLQTLQGMMVVETIVDISVRRHPERMSQRIVEAAPCGMVMIDGEGRIVLINQLTESMFGYTRAELVGCPLEMLLPERLRTGHGVLRTGFAATPSTRQIGAGRDLTARRKDGSEFPVEIGLNPVPGDDGRLVLAAVTDITRRKSMQLELRQANSNLEEFTYAVSHDLKSPLRGISDLVEWIVEDLGGAEPQEVSRNLGRVRDRVQRLERVIDDLLAYARAGTAFTDAVQVDLEDLIAGILEVLPRPAGFNVTVEIKAKPFVTNKAPLESVLRNLTNNAFKHHDLPIGNVAIRIEDAGRYCVFTVSDDGPGIPPASHERVFRIFQTLATETRDHSGIGLALSKRLVEAHGGRIKIDSVAGVRGTAFHVWWPRFQYRKTPDLGGT